MNGLMHDFMEQAKNVPKTVWVVLAAATIGLALYVNANKNKGITVVPQVGNMDSYGKVSETEISSRLNDVTNKLTQQYKDQRESEIGALKDGYDASLSEFQKSQEEKLNNVELSWEQKMNGLESMWTQKENAWEEREKSLLEQIALASRKVSSGGGSSASYDYSPPSTYYESSPIPTSPNYNDSKFQYSEPTGNKYNDLVNYQQTERDRVLGGYYDNPSNRQFLHGDELRNYEYAKATGDYSHYKPTGVESWQ